MKKEFINMATTLLFEAVRAGASLSPGLVERSFQCAETFNNEIQKRALFIDDTCPSCDQKIKIIAAGNIFETRCDCHNSRGQTEESAIKNHIASRKEKNA